MAILAGAATIALVVAEAAVGDVCLEVHTTVATRALVVRALALSGLASLAWMTSIGASTAVGCVCLCIDTCVAAAGAIAWAVAAAIEASLPCATSIATSAAVVLVGLQVKAEIATGPFVFVTADTLGALLEHGAFGATFAAVVLVVA